jgi:hypothetical protein
MLSPIDLLILVLRAIVIILVINVVFSWIRFAGGRVPRYNPSCALSTASATRFWSRSAKCRIACFAVRAWGLCPSTFRR